MISKPFGPHPLSLAAGRLLFAAAGIRNGAYDLIPRLAKRASMPVVSVGCIHAGGTGKTPLSLLIGRRIAELGKTALFVSRGYGRASTGPVVIQPRQDAPCELVGDEPALLRQNLPEAWLVVGRDRHQTLSRVPREIASRAVAVLDDGFQHRRISRDLDVVCLPTNPFDDFALPAGYLREPVESLARASVLCVVGGWNEEGAVAESAQRVRSRFPGKPVFGMIQRPGSWVCLGTGRAGPAPPPGQHLLICGIARPERFISMVRGTGMDPCDVRIFPDHHRYGMRDFDQLPRGPTRVIVTTEKDAVRMRRLKLVNDFAIWYLTLVLEFLDPGSYKEFLAFVENVGSLL